MAEQIKAKDVDILREAIARKTSENKLMINVQTPEAKKKVRNNDLVIEAYQRLVNVSEELVNV